MTRAVRWMVATAIDGVFIIGFLLALLLASKLLGDAVISPTCAAPCDGPVGTFLVGALLTWLLLSILYLALLTRRRRSTGWVLAREVWRDR